MHALLRYLLGLMLLLGGTIQLRSEPLPNTKPLTEEGDLAALMVEGINKYLERETAASVEKRKQHWKLDFTSKQAFSKSVEPNRERLKKILGIVDERVKFTDIEYVGGPNSPALVAETDRYKVYSVRWPVLPGVDGEGLLLEPKKKPIALAVAIPDALQTPEQLVGLAPGIPEDSQFARRLAEDGYRVVVPVLIDRENEYSQNDRLRRFTNIPHREFIYRMAYEMGRHLLGYEVQKILAVVDWFSLEKDHPPIVVCGWGDGGLLSFYAGAVDTRIKGTLVSGYFGEREGLWKETIERNVWQLLTEFGDAEIAMLYLDRALAIEIIDGPAISGSYPSLQPKAKGLKAAPGNVEPKQTNPNAEFKRFERLTKDRKFETPGYLLTEVTDGRRVHPFSLAFLHGALGIKPEIVKTAMPKDLRKEFNPERRQRRQFDQIVNHVQKLWHDSELVRPVRFSKADYSSPEKYDRSVEPIRDYFWEEIIGKLPAPTLPMNPKSREVYDTPKWKGYEVTLDLYPDVFAEGILLLPKDLKPNEKRPVVVCQHGLEGRPRDVCNPLEKTKYYNSFGAQLADLGYIVFAPQNPYIFENKFRDINRRGNPLKLSLFSFIVQQHERILDWLCTLPNVDGDRIAFYGLSYGGKTAMRVPAILKKYCLSICSGDFNEWIGKMVSMNLDRGYMWTREYEMYEFNLGETFNYMEMAALIAPRPFMVERGHDDGVGTDEMVAFEFAKVRYLYANRLKIPDRTTIEFFVGGHVINGKGTFDFLKQHLKWPGK
ncbi:MAG: hypothetical protein K8T89_05990 [Planctomycetes bacterium]|nr:hypothetical protein [Planctomycetota bacterium]